jgi:predicted nucleotide-binding protein
MKERLTQNRIEEFYNAIPEDRPIGNQALSYKLGWTDDLYARVKKVLLRDCRIKLGQGRGGSVARANAQLLLDESCDENDILPRISDVFIANLHPVSKRIESQEVSDATDNLAQGHGEIDTFIQPLTNNNAERQVEKNSSINTSYSNKIFIVHGHDDATKNAIARWLEKQGFEAIILHERPNKGRTIIAKLLDEAEAVGFAIVLLTPDDEGKASNAPEYRHRARQNVIFELGLFIGKLGSGRVAALYKGDIELPSDYEGVAYTPYDDHGGWKAKLAHELEHAGYVIDFKKAVA